MTLLDADFSMYNVIDCNVPIKCCWINILIMFKSIWFDQNLSEYFRFSFGLSVIQTILGPFGNLKSPTPVSYEKNCRSPPHPPTACHRQVMSEAGLGVAAVKVQWKYGQNMKQYLQQFSKLKCQKIYDFCPNRVDQWTIYMCQ